MLSSATTWSPRPRSTSTRWDPMKPAPPVTRYLRADFTPWEDPAVSVSGSMHRVTITARPFRPRPTDPTRRAEVRFPPAHRFQSTSFPSDLAEHLSSSDAAGALSIICTTRERDRPLGTLIGRMGLPGTGNRPLHIDVDAQTDFDQTTPRRSRAAVLSANFRAKCINLRCNLVAATGKGLRVT